MIQTLIAAMPLAKKSNMKAKSLKQILAPTGRVTSRIFSLVKDLSIGAIITGQECITEMQSLNGQACLAHLPDQLRAESL